MTFYELLKKHSLQELWYILSSRHGLAGKPIKAERMFLLYKSAREELLILHLQDNPTENILVCDLSIEPEESGVLDVWVHCNMISPAEDGSGELQEYAMDFVPWAELIDCNVSEKSIAKLGELVCTAELLWEITFYGYNAERVDNESENLKTLVADIDSGKEETKPWNPEEFAVPKETVEREESAVKEWLINAPQTVKDIVHGLSMSSECDEDESVDEILNRFKDTIDVSIQKGTGDAKLTRLLRAMASDIDIDEKHALLNGMFNG